VPYQRLHFLGTKGRIELELPVNVAPDRETRLLLDSGKDHFGGGITIETFPACDQYTLQGDTFSRAILDNTEVPVPLEDAIGNMAVIEALFRSGASGQWESPHTG
jgi:predicted dehydrogenase